MRKFIYDLNTRLFTDSETSEPIMLHEINEEYELVVSGNLTTLNLLEEIEIFKESYKGITGSITVKVFSDQDYIDKEEELLFLQKINSVCEENNFKFEITLNNETICDEYHNFITAKNEIDNLANKINSMSISNENGIERPLSPFEKFVIVHKFVANRNYNMDKENYFGNNKQRSWIGLLTSDYAICSGYASLLKCVCDKVFTPQELACFTQGCNIFDKEGAIKGGHANNLIVINDPLYKLNGIYLSDSCWDGLGPNGERESARFTYLLNPLQNYGQHNTLSFEFRNCFAFQNLENIANHYVLDWSDDKLAQFLINYGYIMSLNEFALTLNAEQELTIINPNMAEALKDPTSFMAQLALQRFNEICTDKYEGYKLEFIEQNKSFTRPIEITEEALIGGFRALALFEGLTDEKDIENYVNKLVLETTDYRSEAFNGEHTNNEDVNFSLQTHDKDDF